MNACLQYNANKPESIICQSVSVSDQQTVFTDIYQDETNIVIWQRNLSIKLQHCIMALTLNNRTLQASMIVTPQNADASITELLGNTQPSRELSKNIAELVDMFCYLFDLKQAGLRFTTLNHAMCPRFHVDRIPCRLVTTFQGVSTQWLPNHTVDRTKLGAGNQGLPDDRSGIYLSENDICQLKTGDVALLKGERWQGNENAGLVHRSPAVTEGERRLLLTLDFVN